MQEILTISTSKKQELIDITDKVEQIVAKSKVKDGICLVYIPHATAAVILNESADPNIKTDFLNALNKAIPEHNNYLHDRIDNNAAAHIKSAVIGPSETIPIKNGKLELGTWQDIFFVELDGPRSERNIVLKICQE